MKSLRVVGPGWGYPLVFTGLTVPALIGSAGQPGGATRSLVIAALIAVALFGWWRRGVWFANDTDLVVVNWVKRQVVPADGAELELVPLGNAKVSPTRFDPRRVRTLVLVSPEGDRVRVRVVDGGSGRRIQRAVDALQAVLEVTSTTPSRKRRRRR